MSGMITYLDSRRERARGYFSNIVLASKFIKKGSSLFFVSFVRKLAMTC
jgi:hypothetical protein